MSQEEQEQQKNFGIHFFLQRFYFNWSLTLKTRSCHALSWFHFVWLHGTLWAWLYMNSVFVCHQIEISFASWIDIPTRTSTTKRHSILETDLPVTDFQFVSSWHHDLFLQLLSLPTLEWFLDLLENSFVSILCIIKHLNWLNPWLSTNLWAKYSLN